MVRLRHLAAWMLVALWLPATLHCDFEAVGLDTLFHCETDHHSQSDEPASDDSCDVVENGWFKLSATQVGLAAPLLSVCTLCFSSPLPADPLDSPAIEPSEELVAPAEVARTWQFVVRAALPARAPNLSV